MKPVFQTQFGRPDGNCLAACLASIFETDLEEAETWRDLYRPDEYWYIGILRWLGHRNMTAVWLGAKYDNGKIWAPEGYTILAGPSPRGDWGHAVVALHGEIVHDPHPDGGGVLDLEDWTVFYVLDKSNPAPLYDLTLR